MANLFNQFPVVLDTDFSSFRAGQTLQSQAFGLRVYKLSLVVAPGGVSSAGSVTITAPSDSAALYPPMPVSASTPAKTILYTDNLDNQQLPWRDFAVTGLTATGTVLYVWYRVG